MGSHHHLSIPMMTSLPVYLLSVFLVCDSASGYETLYIHIHEDGALESNIENDDDVRPSVAAGKLATTTGPENDTTITTTATTPWGINGIKKAVGIDYSTNMTETDTTMTTTATTPWGIRGIKEAVSNRDSLQLNETSETTSEQEDYFITEGATEPTPDFTPVPSVTPNSVPESTPPNNSSSSEPEPTPEQDIGLPKNLSEYQERRRNRMSRWRMF